MTKKKLLSFIGFCFLVFIWPAKSFTTALQNNYQVYNPTWSVAENGGSMPTETLAPYRIIEEKNHKTPLILIHGTISELRPYCNWKNLLDELEKPQNKSFLEQNPVYIFKYASNTNSWDKTITDLKKGLLELLSDYPPQTKFKVIISSLGGKVFCSALKDTKELDQKFIKGISLGVPFWGTPLLNKELMIDKSQSSNKMINCAVSQVTETLFPELDTHLAWLLPLEKTPKTFPSACLPSLRPRLTNYAVFIDSPLVSKINVSEAEMNEWLIKQINNNDYKHAWDGAMHCKMGWEIEKNFKPIYLFRFNDGLVPIFSSLWLNINLGKFEGQKALSPEVLETIKKTDSKARLFKGLDHSDLTSLIDTSKKHKDLLHNSQDTIGSYILQDLK